MLKKRLGLGGGDREGGKPQQNIPETISTNKKSGYGGMSACT